MTDVIDINAKRPPVIYSVTVAHHYDGTLEFKIDDVADDARSREAVFHAFRRISGADSEIENLTTKLKQAVWSDSEECKIVNADNEKLRARIAELEAAMKPFAGMAQYCDDMSDSESHCVFVGDLRAASDALGEKE